MGKRSEPLMPPSSADELRLENSHLRLALEAGGIGTWEWELGTGRMKWSAQMFRNVGIESWDQDDLYAALLSATHPDDREQIESTLARFSATPGPMRMELRAVWPGGDVHWIVFLGEVCADANGRPVVMRGITIDGTQRRRTEEAAEAALRESERRLRQLNEKLEQLAEERARQLDASRAQMQAILDNSPDWLTLFRATGNGRFIYEDLNRATERAYGLCRDQVIGRRLEEILGTEQAQLPLRHMWACIQTGENQRYTAQRTMAGVTRSVDVMFILVPEKHEGDYFIMATARDITEREAMEQQLRQAQKMETVGQLTGGLAHDFNNLLTAIIGNLELLAPRVTGDLSAHNYVGAAQRAAESGAKLTEQLLAFSRRQHLQPRAVDLNAVIGGMGEILARTIGTSIQVRTNLAPELWPALVDPTQIEIAILNLAINSRDAMPLGGTLLIETRNQRAGTDVIPSELGGRDCICISVRDTGTGMTEEVLRSAVEPFFTTKEVGKGSGLGLSQVYGMVRQSNGSLQIESRLGVGTAVHLYLPRGVSEVDRLNMGLDQTSADETAARILVVDDDPRVREITVQMLRQVGYGVTEVESGQAALDRLSRGEAYDLMVIDVAMPGLNGIETVRSARQRLPGLRALYITGFVDVAGAEPQTGDDPLVKKPFKLDDLKNGVRRAINRTLTNDPGANLVALRKVRPKLAGKAR
jgi:PAS domain S-box-containing protein